VPVCELVQCCLAAPRNGFMLVLFNINAMIFLTVADHGCVYTLSQEDGDELYFAPIYKNGNINLEEFAPVDLDAADMDEMELFDIRNRLVALCQV